MNYHQLAGQALDNELAAVKEAFEAFKARRLSLDMSRGKPAGDQMAVSNELLTAVTGDNIRSAAGLDTRNYGLSDGLPECKTLFAELFGLPADQVIAGGNSSLKMMFDTIGHGVTHGFGDLPWGRQGDIKFLCPAPGYDRHFAVTEYFGIQMIPIAMTAEGPDMAEVRRLCEGDASIKGIWCVPMYSNPQGITYSDAVVDAFAALKPAAPDFRIMWDNAYMVHHLSDDRDVLKNIHAACAAAGNEDLVIQFASTSKISFSGGGVAAMAASPRNIALIKKRLVIESIGPDKINQLRHTRCFQDAAAIDRHMKKHAALIAPKFAVVLDTLAAELGDREILSWTNPKGGYFISVDTLPGCAARVVALCREAGVVLTGAGATYPYGKDPQDSNIRIAPTFPPIGELQMAVDLFCVAVRLASLERLAANQSILQNKD